MVTEQGNLITMVTEAGNLSVNQTSILGQNTYLSLPCKSHNARLVMLLTHKNDPIDTC